jgi:hypothetical protein
VVPLSLQIVLTEAVPTSTGADLESVTCCILPTSYFKNEFISLVNPSNHDGLGLKLDFTNVPILKTVCMSKPSLLYPTGASC